MWIALLGTIVFATLSVASAADACEEQQVAYFKANELRKCSLQIYDFEVCNDTCLASLLKLKAATPACAKLEGSNSTTGTKAEDYVTKCTEYAADTSTKYMPRTSTGLPNCTEEQREPWDKKYGLLSPTQDCRKAWSTTRYCAADCLEKLEEAVLQSPVCTKENDFGYWIGEKEKKYLQRCLLSRSAAVAENRVMRTSPTSDGKLEAAPIASSSTIVASTTAPTTSTPITSAPITSAPMTSVAASTSAVAASLLAVAASLAMAMSI